MNINEVIKYPILTEKTYAQMSNGTYSFAVDWKANRAEVKKTVEFIFEVKVAKVNIISIDKQPTQLGRSKGFTKRIKKAIVSLAEGQINIFPDEVVNTENPTTENKEVEKDQTVESKPKEMSDIEKKVAAKIAAKQKETKVDDSKNEEKKLESKSEKDLPE